MCVREALWFSDDPAFAEDISLSVWVVPEPDWTHVEMAVQTMDGVYGKCRMRASRRMLTIGSLVHPLFVDVS